MSSENLKRALTSYFIKTAKESAPVERVRLCEQAMRDYEICFNQSFPFWGFWGIKSSFLALAVVLVFSFLGIVESPFFGEPVIAGKLKTENGTVEVVRGDKHFLVEDAADLLVGDKINIGDSGSAKIASDYFVSQLVSDTTLHIADLNTLFLEKGKFKGHQMNGVQIKTERGFVRGELGSGVEVHVSESGETTVLPLEKKIYVYDLYSGKKLARAGESIKLRSDTRLEENFDSVENRVSAALSSSQIEAIFGRLVIARSKILTGVEKIVGGERILAHQDIDSAEKSFVSILQILDSGKNLEISHQKNLDRFEISDVYPALKQKTDRIDILTEAKGIETLFRVLAKQKNNMVFTSLETGVGPYDRYILLSYLASLSDAEESAILEHLADNYVISLLQKIQNEPVKIDQITLLNKKIELLPVNEKSRQFLEKLVPLLSPDLAKILREKIDHLF